MFCRLGVPQIQMLRGWWVGQLNGYARTEDKSSGLALAFIGKSVGDRECGSPPCGCFRIPAQLFPSSCSLQVSRARAGLLNNSSFVPRQVNKR